MPFQKTTARKAELNTPQFRRSVRTNPFNPETEVHKVEFLLTSDSYDDLFEAVLEKISLEENTSPVTVFKGLLEKTYHRVNQARYKEDLFEPDIKAVYKAIRYHTSSVSNRYDLIYLNAVNDFLTALVNDSLYPVLKTYPVITNFSEDFNDLLRTMRNNCSPVAEDSMIEYINSVLHEVNSNFDTIQALAESEETGDEDGVEKADKPQKAVIPTPVTLIGVNYLRSELGTDKNLVQLLGSLAESTETMVFYVVTLDRCVYKVFYTGDDVMVDTVIG